MQNAILRILCLKPANQFNQIGFSIFFRPNGWVEWESLSRWFHFHRQVWTLKELQRRLKQPDKELRQSQVCQAQTNDISMTQLSLVFLLCFFVGGWGGWGGGVKRKPIRLRVYWEMNFINTDCNWLDFCCRNYIDLNTSVNRNYRYTETISFVCSLMCRGPQFTDGFHLICITYHETIDTGNL